MVCKGSSASVIFVICITCLFVFSKLDSDHQYFIRVKYDRNSTSLNGMTSSSVVVDTHLPGESTTRFQEEESQSVEGRPVRGRYRYKENFGKLEEGSSEGTKRKDNNKTFVRMENNNGRIENNIMAPESPEKKKIHNNLSQTIEEAGGDSAFAGQFNIKQLNEHLKKCIRESDHEVDMDEYINIFQQLYKFFCMLGTLFGFIGSDVRTKIEILQGYREGSNKSHYETVEKMIEFEKSTDYIHSNKESSGSRTFLRLHRSLIFVSKFLGKMESIGDQDGISRVCKDAYAQTLAKFHPWLIQKGAGIAMLGLPTKKDLIAKVCANGVIDNNEVAPIMKDVIQLTNDIYDQCEKLYTEHDLHALP